MPSTESPSDRFECFDGFSGRPLVRMTRAQALACAHPGPCDDDVAANLDAVEWLADDDTLRAYLRRYGAWDDLADAPQETLRSRTLWMAAGDILEDAGTFDLI